MILALRATALAAILATGACVPASGPGRNILVATPPPVAPGDPCNGVPAEICPR